MQPAAMKSWAVARLARWTEVARAQLAWPLDLEARDSDFLPNFCHGWVVFNVAVAAELLALVVTLVMPRGLVAADTWQDFLLISLFVQWVALGGTAALCFARRYLNRLPNVRALGMAYLLLLCATFVVSELTVWLLWALGRSPSPRPAWYGDFHLLTLTLSAIVYGLLLRYFLAKHELTQRTRSEERAKLAALQSRIRPHFVFNSLNIIASLTRSEPTKAEAAIEDMAELFRMMLSEDETLVPVKNEIEVAKKYLALEALRLDNRLHVEWNIGTFPRRAVMPVLTLQPLLENAIRHGIEELPGGGVLSVTLREAEDRIHIEVRGPLAKPRARGRPPIEAATQSLDNIRQRFQSHYGAAARLTALEQDGIFRVEVVLPTRGGDQ
jgi:two-component system sensor histidine kinase AlgZ